MGARVVGVKQAWSRRLALKAMVRQDGVIGQQPGRQFPITGRPGLKQEGLRIIRERGLERAVEPFHMGVPVRGPGGGPPVGEATRLEAAVEVALELSAVIGEHGARGDGEQRAEGIQGMDGLAAGGGGGLNSQTKCNTLLRCCQGTLLHTPHPRRTLCHCPLTRHGPLPPPNRGNSGSRASKHCSGIDP